MDEVPPAAEIENPYRSPTAESTVAIPPITQAELIRRQHLNHEASIKAIGGLYLLGAMIWLALAIGVVVTVLAGPGFNFGPTFPAPASWVSLMLGFFIVIPGIAGWGLRTLRPWGRWMAVLISVVMIALSIWSPGIGVLLSGYVLYLLLCKKGQMVFSQEYQQIIQQTPHVRIKTSAVTWVVLILFIVGMISLLVYAAR